jgi:hypothetical protein
VTTQVPSEFGFPLPSLYFSLCGDCSRPLPAVEEAVQVGGWVPLEDWAEEDGPAGVSGEVLEEIPAVGLADSAGETVEAEALLAVGDDEVRGRTAWSPQTQS